MIVRAGAPSCVAVIVAGGCFLAHRGFPIPSPAAQGQERQWIPRSDGPVRREGAERDGRSEVVAIGVAQEFQWALDAVQKEMPGGAPWFSRYSRGRESASVSSFAGAPRGPGWVAIRSLREGSLSPTGGLLRFASHAARKTPRERVIRLSLSA